MSSVMSFRPKDFVQMASYKPSEEAGHPSRDNFLPIKFVAQHADGGPENFPEARVVAVIIGFSSFLFNESSWNPSHFGLWLLFSGIFVNQTYSNPEMIAVKIVKWIIAWKKHILLTL